MAPTSMILSHKEQGERWREGEKWKIKKEEERSGSDIACHKPYYA